MMAPLASRTVPVICPVAVCAEAVKVVITNAAKTALANVRIGLRLIAVPPFLECVQDAVPSFATFIETCGRSVKRGYKRKVLRPFRRQGKQEVARRRLLTM
jgi:hypothetical protein